MYVDGMMTWEEANAEIKKRNAIEPWNPDTTVEGLYKEYRAPWQPDSICIKDAKKYEDRIYRYRLKQNPYATQIRCTILKLFCYKHDCLDCPIAQMKWEKDDKV